jgi:hypothetical protein
MPVLILLKLEQTTIGERALRLGWIDLSQCIPTARSDDAK